MKKIIFLAFFLLFFLLPGVIFAQSNCSITLLSPNGGEVIKFGQTYVIRWEQTNISAVNISIGSISLNIASDYKVDESSNIGEYVWQAPNSVGTVKDQFKIWISGYSSGGSCAARDESADYFIMNKEGNADSFLKFGDGVPGLGVDEYTMSWEQKRIDAVSIYYAKKIPNEQNFNYLPIIKNYPVDTSVNGDWQGSYKWDISNLDPDYYSIKVEGYLLGNKVAETISPLFWLVNKAASEKFTSHTEMGEIYDRSAEINGITIGGEGKKYIDYGLTADYGLSKEYWYGTILIDGLTPGTTYHYRIRNGNNLGPDTTFKTKELPSPDNLAFQLLSKGATTNKVRLFWNTSQTTSNVYMCIGSPECFNDLNRWTKIATVNQKNYDTEVTSDVSKVTYFKFQAINTNGSSGNSKILIVSSKSVGAPENIQSKVAGDKAVITWQSKQLVDSYSNSGLIYSLDKSCLDFNSCGKIVSNPTTGLYYNNAEIKDVKGNIYFKIFANGQIFDQIMNVIISDSTNKSNTALNNNQNIIQTKNISNSNINVITANSSEQLKRLSGKIILKVESKGEAYYINPQNKKMYSLGRPDDAFKVMRGQGVGITNNNLYKIPVGTKVSGVDSDNDGLSDNLESALGLDLNKKDTDGDGYSDRIELEGGYNPWGKGKQSIDNKFSSIQKGKILLQVEKKGEAWYINPNDGKRYFLGRPADAFNVMRSLGLGISNNDFEKLH